MNKYKKFAEDVERNFLEPNYLEHKIRYVSNKDSADIIISARHTFGDYLLVGMVGLLQSIQRNPEDILVFNDPSPDMDTIGVAIGQHTMRGAKVNPLFLQADKLVEEIYPILYNGTLPIAGVGINISLPLMLEFSEIGNGISQEAMEEMQFKYFDDVKTAEQNAFILIKKMASMAIAGILYYDAF